VRPPGLGSFAALAVEPQDAVTLVVVEVLDVAGEHFADPQAVQGEQLHERVGAGAVGPGGDDDAAQFVSAQSGCLGLVVDGRTFHGEER
jgi:hypothetical protein